MSKMKVIYTAGPYRADTVYGITCNIERARELSAYVWELGHVALSPHLNTALFDGLVSDQAFLDGTLELMRRADAVVLIPGWQRSEGTKAEIKEAEKLGIPVLYNAMELSNWVEENDND